MIKFKAEFEWHDREAVALQLEHISGLIRDNYPSGDGWSIEGEEGKEKVVIGIDEGLEDLSVDLTL